VSASLSYVFVYVYVCVYFHPWSYTLTISLINGTVFELATKTLGLKSTVVTFGVLIKVNNTVLIYLSLTHLVCQLFIYELLVLILFVDIVLNYCATSCLYFHTGSIIFEKEKFSRKSDRTT